MKGMHHVGITVSGLERGIDFYHGVEDIHAKEAELEAMGVKFFSDVAVVDDGVLAGWRWVYFTDPEGNALELVEIAYTRPEEHAAGIRAYLAGAGAGAA